MKRTLNNGRVKPVHDVGAVKLTQDKDSPKPAPAQPIKSLQFDLFGEFITNNKGDVSNTVEIWERIPKYFPARTLCQWPTGLSHFRPLILSHFSREKLLTQF